MYKPRTSTEDAREMRSFPTPMQSTIGIRPSLYTLRRQTYHCSKDESMHHPGSHSQANPRDQPTSRGQVVPYRTRSVDFGGRSLSWPSDNKRGSVLTDQAPWAFVATILRSAGGNVGRRIPTPAWKQEVSLGVVLEGHGTHVAIPGAAKGAGDVVLSCIDDVRPENRSAFIDCGDSSRWMRGARWMRSWREWTKRIADILTMSMVIPCSRLQDSRV